MGMFKIEVWKRLKYIAKNTERIMGLAEDLNAKLDAVQSALDTEQAEVLAKLDALNAEITALKGEIVPSETASAILARMDAIIADIQSTVTPDEPPPSA